eukprot:scaffold96280_cov32-Tisochrysis_lutea.AAC.1
MFFFQSRCRCLTAPLRLCATRRSTKDIGGGQSELGIERGSSAAVRRAMRWGAALVCLCLCLFLSLSPAGVCGLPVHDRQLRGREGKAGGRFPVAKHLDASFEKGGGSVGNPAPLAAGALPQAVGATEQRPQAVGVAELSLPPVSSNERLVTVQPSVVPVAVGELIDGPVAVPVPSQAQDPIVQSAVDPGTAPVGTPSVVQVMPASVDAPAISVPSVVVVPSSTAPEQVAAPALAEAAVGEPVVVPAVQVADVPAPTASSLVTRDSSAMSTVPAVETVPVHGVEANRLGGRHRGQGKGGDVGTSEQVANTAAERVSPTSTAKVTTGHTVGDQATAETRSAMSMPAAGMYAVQQAVAEKPTKFEDVAAQRPVLHDATPRSVATWKETSEQSMANMAPLEPPVVGESDRPRKRRRKGGGGGIGGTSPSAYLPYVAGLGLVIGLLPALWTRLCARRGAPADGAKKGQRQCMPSLAYTCAEIWRLAQCYVPAIRYMRAANSEDVDSGIGANEGGGYISRFFLREHSGDDCGRLSSAEHGSRASSRGEGIDSMVGSSLNFSVRFDEDDGSTAGDSTREEEAQGDFAGTPTAAAQAESECEMPDISGDCDVRSPTSIGIQRTVSGTLSGSLHSSLHPSVLPEATIAFGSFASLSGRSTPGLLGSSRASNLLPPQPQAASALSDFGDFGEFGEFETDFGAFLEVGDDSRIGAGAVHTAVLDGDGGEGSGAVCDTDDGEGLAPASFSFSFDEASMGEDAWASCATNDQLRVGERGTSNYESTEIEVGATVEHLVTSDPCSSSTGGVNKLPPLEAPAQRPAQNATDMMNQAIEAVATSGIQGMTMAGDLGSRDWARVDSSSPRSRVLTLSRHPPMVTGEGAHSTRYEFNDFDGDDSVLEATIEGAQSESPGLGSTCVANAHPRESTLIEEPRGAVIASLSLAEEESADFEADFEDREFTVFESPIAQPSRGQFGDSIGSDLDPLDPDVFAPGVALVDNLSRSTDLMKTPVENNCSSQITPTEEARRASTSSLSTVQQDDSHFEDEDFTAFEAPVGQPSWGEFGDYADRDFGVFHADGSELDSAHATNWSQSDDAGRTHVRHAHPIQNRLREEGKALATSSIFTAKEPDAHFEDQEFTAIGPAIAQPSSGRFSDEKLEELSSSSRDWDDDVNWDARSQNEMVLAELGQGATSSRAQVLDGATGAFQCGTRSMSMATHDSEASGSMPTNDATHLGDEESRMVVMPMNIQEQVEVEPVCAYQSSVPTEHSLLGPSLATASTKREQDVAMPTAAGTGEVELASAPHSLEVHPALSHTPCASILPTSASVEESQFYNEILRGNAAHVCDEDSKPVAFVMEEGVNIEPESTHQCPAPKVAETPGPSLTKASATRQSDIGIGEVADVRFTLAAISPETHSQQSLTSWVDASPVPVRQQFESQVGSFGPGLQSVTANQMHDVLVGEATQDELAERHLSITSPSPPVCISTITSLSDMSSAASIAGGADSPPIF